MKIEDFFQKGYYINLDTRPERNAQFLKNMKEAGLDGFFERVPAFYYKDSDYNYTWPHQACARSHITTIRKAYDAGYERILVLEDDVFFVEGGLQAIEKSLDSLSRVSEWDLIYLGSMILDPHLNLVADNLLKQDILLTAHAIGYSRTGMAEMYKFIWEGGAALDGWLGNHKTLKKYVTYPLGLAQYHGPSDLNHFGYSAPVSDYTRGYELPFKK